MPPDFLPSLRRKTPPPVQHATAGLADHQERKVVLTDYYAALASAGITVGGQHHPWDVERAVAEGYERVVWAFKAVETIAGNSSRLRYRLRAGEDGDPLADHPLYRLLNVRANPLETGLAFRKRLSGQVLVSRVGAFVEVTNSNGGTPVRLDLLPPARTRIIPDDGANLIKCYQLWGRDGRLEREIDPTRVRWVREPSILDPYAAVTPLSAARWSIELDHFSRIFNLTFLRNDGRPGGIVGVGGADEDVDPKILDEIEARFAKGPHNAGKLTALQGQLSYVDLGAKPRDMHYGALSQNTKTEILVAFGVPESQLGNAAGRTFANADAEGYAFWTLTMASHNDVIISAFEQDSEDELEGFFDTSHVEVLQAPVRARRAEARAEFAAGLRSIRSYAILAGYGDEIDDLPQTRALYLPPNLTAVPSQHADAVAAAADAAAAAPAAPGAPALPGVPGVPGTPAAGLPGTPRTAARAVADHRTGLGAAHPGGGPAAPTGRTAARAVADARTGVNAAPPLRLVVNRHPQTKTAAATAAWAESDADPTSSARLETAVTVALDALVTRWQERTVARLESPKARRGTRHWTPEYAVDTRLGAKALDAARVVDEDRFAAEAQATLSPLITAAAVTAATGVVTDLGWTGAVDAYDPPDPSAEPTTGDSDALSVGAVLATVALVTAAQAAGSLPGWLTRRILAGPVAEALNLIGTSAQHAAAALADAVNAADQAGAPIGDLTAAVRDWAGRQQEWARGLATQVATSVTEGARDAAGSGVADTGIVPATDIVRRWVTRGDDRVRPTHRLANGQERRPGAPFTVGAALLRYPGDPTAPYAETAGCRCRLVHRSKASGRFSTTPAGAITRAPAGGLLPRVPAVG